MDNLKVIRKAAGLSQIGLARRAGVSRFRLYLAEAGTLELRPDEMVAINRAIAPELERVERIASEVRRTTCAAEGHCCG